MTATKHMRGVHGDQSTRTHCHSSEGAAVGMGEHPTRELHPQPPACCWSELFLKAQRELALQSTR